MSTMWLVCQQQNYFNTHTHTKVKSTSLKKYSLELHTLGFPEQGMECPLYEPWKVTAFSTRVLLQKETSNAKCGSVLQTSSRPMSSEAHDGLGGAQCSAKSQKTLWWCCQLPYVNVVVQTPETPCHTLVDFFCQWGLGRGGIQSNLPMILCIQNSTEFVLWWQFCLHQYEP